MGDYRKATRVISGFVDRGYLVLAIDGVGSRFWHLPSHWDRDGVRKIADEAKAWAADEGDATLGQTKYIQQVLSEAGYFAGVPRRLV